MLFLCTKKDSHKTRLVSGYTKLNHSRFRIKMTFNTERRALFTLFAMNKTIAVLSNKLC